MSIIEEEVTLADDQDDITILHDLQLHDEDGNLYPIGSPPQFQFFREGGAGGVGVSQSAPEDTAGSTAALKTAYDHVRGQNEQYRKQNEMLKKGLKSVHDKNQQLKMLAKATPVASFHAAAASGNVDQIHELLEAGVDVNGRNSEGRTGLHTAANSGQKNVCSLLLHANSDPNAVDNDGRCPIHMACRNEDIEICKLLVEFGADINAMDRDGRTCIHIASANGNPEICTLLIEALKDASSGDTIDIINETDIYGQTPISMAQKNRHSDVFKILQEAGADVPPVVDNRPIDRSDDNPREISLGRFEGKIATMQKIIQSLYQILFVLVNSVDVISQFPDLKERIYKLRMTPHDVDEGSEVNELQSIEHTLDDAIGLEKWVKSQSQAQNSDVASGQSESRSELERRLLDVQTEMLETKHELECLYKENVDLKEEVKNYQQEIQRLRSDAENVDLYSATNLDEDGELYDIGRLFAKVANLERNSRDLSELVQSQAHRMKGQRRGSQSRQFQQSKQASSSLPGPQRNRESNSGTSRQASSLQNENNTSRNYLRIHDIRLPPSDLEHPNPNNRAQTATSDPHRQMQPSGFQQASPQHKPRHGSTGQMPLNPGRRQENVKQAGPDSWPHEHHKTNTVGALRLSQSNPSRIPDSDTTRPSANRSPGFVPRSPSREVPNQPFESVRGPPAVDYSSQNQGRYVEGASQVHIYEDGLPTSPRRSGSGQSNQRFPPTSTPSGEIQNMYPVSCSDERQQIGSRDQIVVPGGRTPQEDVWTTTTTADHVILQRDELATGMEPVGRQRFGHGQTGFNASQQLTREPAPKQAECPVCRIRFAQGTSEDYMTAHVNRHFDETDRRADVGDFEVLGSPS